MMSREDIPHRVAEILGRPARWASPGITSGSYDGCDRTVEIFNAAPSEQLELLRLLRAERSALERAAGGPLVIVFHTPSETRRLYADMLQVSPPRRVRYSTLARAFDRWMARDHKGDPAVDPNEIERFTFPTDRAA